MPGFLGGSSSGGGTGGEIRFPAELIDPVTKLRVSEPQTMMDTDFEYGLQPTKWETVELINNTPSFFSQSGDTTIPNLLDLTTTAGSREVKLRTSIPHGLAVGIPINVTGSKSLTADGAYIINSVPDSTTFTYLCKQNQLTTASIVDLYTSIITGQFFQGSQIKISDSDGIITNAQGQSTLTVTTDSPHGFGVNTPFYFLNLNSTVSQEFDSSNTGAKTFDSSNSSSAQSFDGSNTFSTFAVDVNSTSHSGATASTVVTVNTTADTITVTHTTENFVGKQIGTALYHNVASASGYFASNPRGVVYLRSVDQLASGSSTFQVSLTPGGTAVDITATITGTFQLAVNSQLFAGNNLDNTNQPTLTLTSGSPIGFDGANTLGTTSSVNSFSNGSALIQMQNDAGSAVSTGLQVGSMVFYTTTGTAAGGLTNNTTYWLTYFNIIVAPAPGLVQIKLTDTVGGNDIVISSQGSGTHKFKGIGVSVDKNIIYAPAHGLATGDMIKYSYPSGGAVTFSGFTKQYAYVTRVNVDNLSLEANAGLQVSSTGAVTSITANGSAYKVHAFTSVTTSATFTVSGTGTIEYLIVGGGGSGGSDMGGGGGAGGYLAGSQAVTAGTYTVSVGAGGSGNNAGVGNRRGWEGGNSSIVGNGVNLIAYGGGGGASNHDRSDNPAGGSNIGLTVGSGGGCSGGNGGASGGSGYGGSRWGDASNLTPVQGFRGGIGIGYWYPCGGGGAGGVGGSNPGHGGIGKQNDILGTNYYWAGGGGGSGYSDRGGDGGAGGGAGGPVGSSTGGSGINAGANGPGGGGGAQINIPGTNGGTNTGGGGSGGAHYSSNNYGGSGGSGIVVIRFKG